MAGYGAWELPQYAQDFCVELVGTGSGSPHAALSALMDVGTEAKLGTTYWVTSCIVGGDTATGALFFVAVFSSAITALCIEPLWT